MPRDVRNRLLSDTASGCPNAPPRSVPQLVLAVNRTNVACMGMRTRQVESSLKVFMVDFLLFGAASGHMPMPVFGWVSGGQSAADLRTYAFGWAAGERPKAASQTTLKALSDSSESQEIGLPLMKTVNSLIHFH